MKPHAALFVLIIALLIHCQPYSDTYEKEVRLKNGRKTILYKRGVIDTVIMEKTFMDKTNLLLASKKYNYEDSLISVCYYYTDFTYENIRQTPKHCFFVSINTELEKQKIFPKELIIEDAYNYDDLVDEDITFHRTLITSIKRYSLRDTTGEMIYKLEFDDGGFLEKIEGCGVGHSCALYPKDTINISDKLKVLSYHARGCCGYDFEVNYVYSEKKHIIDTVALERKDITHNRTICTYTFPKAGNYTVQVEGKLMKEGKVIKVYESACNVEVVE